MKRNLLLGFLLLGLVVLEWGCMGWGGSCDPVPDEYHKITGFSDVWLASYQNNIVKDSAFYDTIVFDFYVMTELVACNDERVILQSALFATEPCPPPAQVIITKFDSLKITASISGEVKDITNFFGVNAQTSITDGRYSYAWVSLDESDAMSYINSIKNYNMPNLTLGILRTIGLTIDSPITFQFFDTEGNIFETTTDPIIITP